MNTVEINTSVENLLALTDSQLARRVRNAFAALGVEDATALASWLGAEVDIGNVGEFFDADDFYPDRSLPDKLLQRGALLTAVQLCTALGITRQALNTAVASQRVFTVEIGTAQYYPEFFASKKINKRSLAKVTRLLGNLPGWTKWYFFTLPKASLGDVTPLAALACGDADLVCKSAVAHMER